ncbi:tubulin binding cofactor C-domain-containing protein [Lenzites betulinus]|nr:tubulin binding cofactor C-domain-containing protein [Lenzites betulinus]
MSETNQELTQQFYSRFQPGTSELLAQLEILRNSAVTVDAVEKIVVDAAKLRKELTDAIGYLPGYDRRQCENKLQDIETQVEAIRVSAAPKSKFAFKRKTAKSTLVPSPVTSTPTGSSAAPSSSISHASGLSLSGHSNSYLTLTSLSSPWSAASDLTISDLDHCVVNLIPSSANPDAPADLTFNALHVRNVTDTVLILPILPGSALLHDMKNCVIALGSRQFRMHTSERVDVYISIASNPIIEHCSLIRFADYPQQLRPASTDAAQEVKSNYLAVQDFSHIRATPSPNWSELPQDQNLPGERWPLQGAADTKALLQNLLPVS